MSKNKDEKGKYFEKLMEEIAGQKDYVTDYPKINTLKAIADVESGGGKYLKHKPVSGEMHKGSAAIGKYALMPSTIKETEKGLSNLSDAEIHKKIMQNPDLQERIASKYYDRLRQQLGTNDPEAIGYGWLQGITGAKRALNKGEDIGEHWHVKKIRNAYVNPLELDQRKQKDLEEKFPQRMPASIEPDDEDEDEGYDEEEPIEDSPANKYDFEEPEAIKAIKERISDMAHYAISHLDPTQIRERRIEEKQIQKEKEEEDKYLKDLKEKQRLRAEATRKKILERKD